MHTTITEYRTRSFTYPTQEIVMYRLERQCKEDPRYRVDWHRDIGIGHVDVQVICAPTYRLKKDAMAYIKTVMKTGDWIKIV